MVSSSASARTQNAPTKTHKKPRPKTKNLHSNPQKAQAKNKKPPPKPTKSPGQKQKTSTQTHKKPRPKTKTHQNPQKGFTSTTPQASPPHELRKGRAALPRGPFAIRGGWGDWSPHKKIKNLWGLVSPQKRQNWSIVANRGNLRKGVCLSNGIGLMNPF